MRISDWSSDVCSSDLRFPQGHTRSCSSSRAGSSHAARTVRENCAGVPVTCRARCLYPLPPDRQRRPEGHAVHSYLARRARYPGAECRNADRGCSSRNCRASDRKSVEEGKSVYVRVDFGGSRNIKKTMKKTIQKK